MSVHKCAQEMGVKDLIQCLIESVEESIDSTGNESGPIHLFVKAQP